MKLDVPGDGLRLVMASEVPDLLQKIDRDLTGEWPEFMLHDTVANRFWARLYSQFAGFQFALLDDSSGRLAAAGNCIPFSLPEDGQGLPDTGWDATLANGFECLDCGRAPDALSALAITVGAEFRGRGLSGIMLQTMKNLGRDESLEVLAAPVRPNMKHLYPLIPMEQYMLWKRSDGFPFDPWLRVHIRSGGELDRVCSASMTITGSIGEWSDWTDLDFPESGRYIVKDALVPVTADTASNRCTYIEPNIWVVHQLRQG